MRLQESVRPDLERQEDAATHPHRGQLPLASQVEPEALRLLRVLRRLPPEGGTTESAVSLQSGVTNLLRLFIGCIINEFIST